MSASSSSTVPPVLPDPDPDFQPDPQAAARWRSIVDDQRRERRPPREAVLPFLLIRSYLPATPGDAGDRGARPAWPPIVCWESPDLLLMDAADDGPFDPNRLVAAPQVGRTYRAFVRVWNLGLLPAVGVHVRMWAVRPGFFTGDTSNPYYRDHFIGGAWIPRLGDRRGPDCVAVVELDAPWTPGDADEGHECLVASATCAADPFAGLVLVNTDRHVAQRNLTVLGGEDSAAQLLNTLGGLVPAGGTLELTHGARAVGPVLRGIGGPGILIPSTGEHDPIVAPGPSAIHGGVHAGGTVHLLTAFEDDGGGVLVRSDALREAAVGAGLIDPEDSTPFARPGGTRDLLERLGRKAWPEVGLVTGKPLAGVLAPGAAELFDWADLYADTIARRLGGPPGADHLLRFGTTGKAPGGYSVVFRR